MNVSDIALTDFQILSLEEAQARFAELLVNPEALQLRIALFQELGSTVASSNDSETTEQLRPLCQKIVEHGAMISEEEMAKVSSDVAMLQELHAAIWNAEPGSFWSGPVENYLVKNKELSSLSEPSSSLESTVGPEHAGIVRIESRSASPRSWGISRTNPESSRASAPQENSTNQRRTVWALAGSVILLLATNIYWAAHEAGLREAIAHQSNKGASPETDWPALNKFANLAVQIAEEHQKHAYELAELKQQNEILTAQYEDLRQVHQHSTNPNRVVILSRNDSNLPSFEQFEENHLMPKPETEVVGLVQEEPLLDESDLPPSENFVSNKPEGDR